MLAIKNQKRINLIYVLGSLFFYNAYLLQKYFNLGIFTNTYITNQYQFNYQNCGFVARGLLPSILEFLGINNQFGYYALYNVVVLLYACLIVYISGLYEIKNRNLYIIASLFFFFGIPHFTIEGLRTDSILLLNTLIVFILLKRKQYIPFLIISIFTLFIHEVAIFLFVPVIFLLLEGKEKWIYSFILGIVFVGIVLLSNKITEQQAIEILQRVNEEEIAYGNYALYILNTKESIRFFFGEVGVALFLVYGVFYILALFLAFKALFTTKITAFRWLFLMPLVLCFVAVDYPRWYCFVYFLAMLYALHYNLFNRKAFIYIALVTVLFGIPKGTSYDFGVLPFLFKLLSKIL